MLYFSQAAILDRPENGDLRKPVRNLYVCVGFTLGCRAQSGIALIHRCF